MRGGDWPSKASGTDYVLEIRNVTKRFGSVPVLRNVNLRVRGGSIHAVVGHNGAGKSTLMKIALGAVSPSEGEVFVAGQKLTYARPAEARDLGLGMVMQERSLIDTLNGLDNLFLNAERRNGLGLVETRKQRQEAAGLLQELGIPSSLLSAKARDMSAIEQELMEIGRALRLGSKVLILDEPTAPLGREEIARLFKVLRTIAARGTGIVIITHHLAEIFTISDEVTCLREGRVVLDCPTRETSMNSLVAAMLGRNDWNNAAKSRNPVRESGTFVSNEREATPPTLSVKNLRIGNKLTTVSFDAWPGEILGIVGLAGSGRTTLLRSLFGDVAIDAGQITIRGQPYRPGSPEAAMARGVFLVPESRGVHGLVLTKSIAENILLPLLGRLTNRFGLLRQRKGRNLARNVLKELDVRAAGIDQIVGELSGGNQQKIVIGKALLLDADVLLLDEPSYGVDIGATQEIIRNVRAMAARGATVLWVSSDLLEVSQVSDRILVLREGRVDATLGPGDRDQFTEDALLPLMQRAQFH